MTGGLDTDLCAKFQTAATFFREVNLVVVHIKGTDVASHERRALEKRDFISAVDAALGQCLLGQGGLPRNLRIVVSASHGTSSISGLHLGCPVPLLVSTWRPDSEDQEAFDEESCGQGALGVFESGDLGAMLGLAPEAAVEPQLASVAVAASTRTGESSEPPA
jgi:2,3-bisphosphoglycerate-independent phosphoglycerate mutase